MADLLRAVALLSFSVGALFVAVGDRRRGTRCIAFAVALVAVEPLIAAGLASLAKLERPREVQLDRILLGLFLLAVVLAGVVALRGRARRAEPTSKKDRVEPRP